MIRVGLLLSSLVVSVLVGMFAPNAKAGAILFDFEAVATDVSRTEFIDTFPGILESDLVGGLGAGGTLAGSISVSDLSIDDSSVGGEADRFSLFDNVSDLNLPGVSPQDGYGFGWEFGAESANLLDARHATNNQSISLTLMDSPGGDSISISISRSGGVRSTVRSINIVFADPTGTVFPGTGNLTGNYADAIELLTTLDFSRFSEASVQVNSVTGRIGSVQQTIVGDITGFNIRSVPEPSSLAFLAFGLVLLGSTRRRLGSSCTNRAC